MKRGPPSMLAHVAALGALLALLALSVIVARIHLGVASVVLGPAIAALKAGIVVVFFMKLQSHGPAVRIAAVVGVVWLAILVALTLGDLLLRSPVIVQ